MQPFLFDILILTLSLIMSIASIQYGISGMLSLFAGIHTPYVANYCIQNGIFILSRFYDEVSLDHEWYLIAVIYAVAVAYGESCIEWLMKDSSNSFWGGTLGLFCTVCVTYCLAHYTVNSGWLHNPNQSYVIKAFNQYEAYIHKVVDVICDVLDSIL